MTNLSTKRARQRAKQTAALGGVSHQQALDGIARDAGHRHWGDMRRHLPDPVALDYGLRPGISWEADSGSHPSLLDRRLLTCGEDMPHVCEALLVSSLCAVEGSVFEALGRLVFRSRIRDLTQDPCVLLLAEGPLSKSVLGIMQQAIVEGERIVREHAESGAFWSGSWEALVFQCIRMMADGVEPSSSDSAVILSASPAIVVESLRSLVERLAKMEGEPLELPDGELAARLPLGFLRSVVLQRSRDVALSAWQRSVVRSLLDAHRGGRMKDVPFRTAADIGGIDILSAALALHALGADFPCDLLVRLFDMDLFGESSTDVGSPFVDFLQMPSGESAFDRWLRDAHRKVAQARRPFSYNPLPKEVWDMREQAPSVMRSLVDACVTRDLHSFTDRAVVVLSDVAVVLAAAGEAACEIGVDKSASSAVPRSWDRPSLTDVLQAIVANRHEMHQISLFATIHGVGDVKGIEDAIVDHEVVDLAIRALRPFQNPAIAAAVA